MPLSPLATRCPPDDANPVPWTRPAEPDNLRRYPASFLVSRHSAFLAVLDAGTPEITLQGRPPQMHPTAIPRLKRLAEAPKGAAPIVGSTPRTPFGILADPENDSATVRHRALLVRGPPGRSRQGRARRLAAPDPSNRQNLLPQRHARLERRRGWPRCLSSRLSRLHQKYPKVAARVRILLEALR